LGYLPYDLFGGGGPDYPPNYFTFQHRLNRPHGGPHPLYTAFIGISTDVVVNQAGIHLVSAHGGPSPNQPLVKDPPDQFAGLRLGLSAFATVVKALHPLEVLSLNIGIFAVGALTQLVRMGVAIMGCIDPTPAEPVTCAASLFAAGVIFTGVGILYNLSVKFFKEATLPAFEDWGLR
jgi:hypothetical protein